MNVMVDHEDQTTIDTKELGEEFPGQIHFKQLSPGLGFHKKPSINLSSVPKTPPQTASTKRRVALHPDRPPGKNFPMYQPILGDHPKPQVQSAWPTSSPISVTPQPAAVEQPKVKKAEHFFWSRVGALFVDLSAGVLVALVSAAVAISLNATFDIARSSVWINLLLFSLGLFVGGRICTTLVSGSSLGQSLMGLVIVNSQTGKPVGPFRASLRNFLSIVATLSLGGSWLWCLVDSKGRAFHDWLLGCHLAKRESWVSSLEVGMHSSGKAADSKN